MADAALSTSRKNVHPPLKDIPAFVSEMEEYGYKYIAWVEGNEVRGIYRLEPVGEHKMEFEERVTELLWSLHHTKDGKRLVGDYCAATGRTYSQH